MAGRQGALRHERRILAIYMAHRGALVNYANGIVGDLAHAEEVVQEAWVRFGAAANRRALDEPVGDLYRIVCDLAIDSHRRRIRENRIVEPATAKASETTADGTPSPETAAVAMARVDVVYPGPVAARPVLRSLHPERPLGRRTGAMARTPHCRGAHYCPDAHLWAGVHIMAAWFGEVLPRPRTIRPERPAPGMKYGHGL